ncbi:MAG: NADH-quinone oxidoreductase subunit L [Deltaproteobacteria bacterium HGW-Deltaproteobacteria-14]|jgi:NADH-quinone oxidoreductase subunit L|nr:MAG: NADH-quinone oxidoreductase subunit L [Deltaproteobacteria bacterium HGW-Deltaproteobacteria-14]
MEARIPHPSDLLALIVLLPLIGAFINGVFGRHMSKRAVAFFGVGSVAATFALSVVAVFRLSALPDQDFLYADLWQWFSSGEVTIELSLLLDHLSAVMLLVVTGVGGIIHIFSLGYMRDDPGFARYFSYLNLFMFSMILLILGKNLLVMFIGWEGVGLCSYLLIGFWFTDMQKAEAGQKAFITNRVGDLAFLIGTFILLFYSWGSLDFVGADGVSGLQSTAQQLANAPNGGVVITLVTLLFFVGATGKSAQIPLYVWLPDAMAGPTPVSALIHAATMVTAGVYMMARLNFMFALSETTMTVVAVIGAMTAFVAATIALVQNDIKKVLAYSTVSQIGFMVVAIGVGSFVGAIFHLMTHAFFKATLFLGSGSVIHGLHHEQDIRKMGGLKKKFPVTRWTFLIACLAIAGIPFFAGFFSKDEILFFAATAHRQGAAPLTIVYIIAALAALMTAFYMFRLYFLTFEGTYRGDKHTWDHAHEEWVMNWPLITLAFLSTVGGFLGLPHFLHAHVLDGWLEPLFGWMYSGGHEHALYVLNHDMGTELALMGVSVVVALVGVGLAWHLYMRGRLPVAPVEAGWHKLLTNKYYVDEFYDLAVIRPLRALARGLYRIVDVKIIDGIFVRGSAQLVSKIGDGLRVLQNGDVQAYATAIVVGLAAVLLLVGALK